MSLLRTEPRPNDGRAFKIHWIAATLLVFFFVYDVRRRTGRRRFVFELGRVQRRGRERDENATEISRTSRRRVHVVRQPEFQHAQRQEQPVDQQQRTKIEVGSVQVSARVQIFHLVGVFWSRFFTTLGANHVASKFDLNNENVEFTYEKSNPNGLQTNK